MRFLRHTILVYLLLTYVSFAAIAGPPSTAEELLDRIRFAADSRLDTAIVVGTSREYQSAGTLDKDRIKAEVEQHRAELNANLSNGIGLSDQDWSDLKAAGFANVQDALKNPTFKSLFAEHVNRMAGSFERTLLVHNAEKLEESRLTITTAGSDRLRKEKVITTYTAAGRAAQPAGTRIITAVNQQFWKDYMPDEHSGTVQRGSAENPGLQQAQLGWPNCLQGGKPVVVPRHWTEKQVLSMETVDTPEGKATKVLMVDANENGVGTTLVVWFLPEKGYSLYRSESYMHGRLRETRQYGDYREIEGGLWYPFKQQVEHVDTDLPPDIQERLKSGILSLGSEEVRKTQVVKRRRTYELAVESVRVNVPVEDKQFQIDFPPGTEVHDFILSKYSGQAYTYTVGATPKEVDDTILKIDGTPLRLNGDTGQSETTKANQMPSAKGQGLAQTITASAWRTYWLWLIIGASAAIVAMAAIYKLRSRRTA